MIILDQQSSGPSAFAIFASELPAQLCHNSIRWLYAKCPAESLASRGYFLLSLLTSCIKPGAILQAQQLNTVWAAFCVWGHREGRACCSLHGGRELQAQSFLIFKTESSWDFFLNHGLLLLARGVAARQGSLWEFTHGVDYRQGIISPSWRRSGWTIAQPTAQWLFRSEEWTEMPVLTVEPWHGMRNVRPEISKQICSAFSDGEDMIVHL